MGAYPAIDADTHITEPADVWTARVPRRFRERVPHVERNDAGQDVWVIDGQHMAAVGFTATAGWKEEFPSGPPTFGDCLPAAYDAKVRLDYMDSQGIWSQVIYPNVGGFGSQSFLKMDDVVAREKGTPQGSPMTPRTQ